jgi:Domain of unknown function (DUF2382)/PRC-barrel domain
MPDINTVQNWQGRTMVDRDGDKLGTIDAIYLDDTGQPEWGLIYTGLFGTKATFVPLAQAQPMGDSVQVPYHRDQVKDAPNMQADGQLSQDEEAELYRHYGLDDSQHRSEEEHEVTLREEEVVVDRRAVPKERVRLGTETVTEERQVSEEVRREQLQVDGDQDQLPRRDRR